MKWSYLDSNSFMFVPKDSLDNESAFFLHVNGLAPNKYQVITWTRCNHDLWHYMASLDHNELPLSSAIWNIMRICPQHICSCHGSARISEVITLTIFSKYTLVFESKF